MKLSPDVKLLKLLMLIGLSAAGATTTELPNAKSASQLIRRISDASTATASTGVGFVTSSASTSSSNKTVPSSAEKQQEKTTSKQASNDQDQAAANIVQRQLLANSSESSQLNSSSEQTQIAEPRQDTGPTTTAASPASAQTTSSQDSKHQNHHYPADHYPSASYANLIHRPRAPLSAAHITQKNAQPAIQQQQVSLAHLISRDHHPQMNPFSLQPSSYNGADNGEQLLLSGFNDQLLSFANYSPSSRSSLIGLDELLAASNNQVHNHNYGPAPSAPNSGVQVANLVPTNAAFNAGLIQNLTASLFPVQKLSNATMSTLSELLANRTRQEQQPQVVPGLPFKSTNNNGNNLYQQLNSDHLVQSPIASSAGGSNYLEALLGDHRFNSAMLDYMHRPTTNSAVSATWSAPLSSYTTALAGQRQFGFRETGSANRLQSQQRQANQQQNKARGQQQVGHEHSGRSTSSNNHNTYAQVPGIRAEEAGHQRQAATTNGQALNAAASLYENYLDQTYRYPLMAQQTVASSREPTNSANSYHFIQQHTNNQNHLDKVVYHSTPFRPSIVSPPTLASSMTQQSNSSAHLIGRPKSEADSKSLAYASLNGNNNHYHSHNHSPEFTTMTNEQYLNERNSSRAAQSGNKFEPMKQHDDYDTAFERFASTSGAYNSSASNQHEARQQNQTNPLDSSRQQQVGNGQAQQQSLSSLAQMPGPQLLLDLYEREIDNQIREAIYTDHQQHFHHHLATNAASTSTSALPSAASSTIGWPTAPPSLSMGPTFDEALDPLSNWRSPASTVSSGRTASGAQVAAASGQMASSAFRPAVGSPQLSSADSLAAALQELPIFSASDLQPILPQGATSPAMLSMASFNQYAGSPAEQQLSEATDASALSSLAAQLLPYSAPGASSYLAPSTLSNLLLGTTTSAYGGNSQQDPQRFNSFATFTMPSNGHGSRQQPHAQSSSPHPTTALPSLLLKLQSVGPLSSILTSPFAHIYANLPRYRYHSGTWNKPHGARQHKAEQQPVAAGALRKQQSAAALAAATAAHLIAASGQSLTPLQVAMIQAQAATSAYLNAAEPPAASSAAEGSIYDSHATQTMRPDNGNQSGATLASLTSAIPPLVWRNILSPMHWSRKQTNGSSGQQSTTAASGSQQLVKQQGHPSTEHQQQTSAAAPLSGSIWASSSPLSQLSAPLAGANPVSSLAQAPGTSPASGERRPKLRIKILKIPVAFYENPTAVGSNSAPTSTQPLISSPPNPAASDQLNLMPAHLQPSPAAASLMASLSCPLHQHQAQEPITSLGHFFTNHFSPIITSSFQAAPNPPPAGQQSSSILSGSQSPGSSPTASSATQAAPSIAQHSGGGASGGSPNKPISIRDFTDINQPNDLQVSPAMRTANSSNSLLRLFQ